MSVPCRLGTLTYKLQVKIRGGRAPTWWHKSHSSRPCPMLRRATVLSHVTQLQTPPLCLGGLQRCHASLGSGPHPTSKVSSDAAMSPWLRNPPLRKRGVQCWHAAHGFPQAVGHENKEAMIDMQQGTYVSETHPHVFKAHPHVSKTSDTWAIMVSKTCGQATPLIATRRVDRQLQCCAGPVDHS
jgi:hypothetical protein